MYPIKSIREAKQLEIKIVNSFLRKKDVPSWYRGCSESQWFAMDSLQNAIRDDSEQGTGDRVYHCLSKIGITPLETNKNIQLVMKLSGGNDLAFLWFLMEMFYKSPKEDEYTLNEQLILSSIAHLDMVTTLRGLDQLLPPGHASKQKSKRIELKQKLHKPKKPVKVRSTNVESPYFEKLPVPLRIPTRALYSKQPRIKAKLFCYEIYKDPNYTPPNEKNRWFAQMDNPNEETREHLDNIFKKIPLPKQIHPEVTNIIDMALDRMHNLSSSPSKCWHHQREECDERRRRNKMFESRQKYLMKFISMSKCKEDRHELISQTLEKDIGNYELSLRKQPESRGNKSNVRLLGKDEFCEFFIRDSDGEPMERSSMIKLNRDPLKQRHPRFSAGNERHGEALVLNCYCEKYNYGHVDCDTTPNSSKCYFKAPKEHKPYIFDYPKIYKNEDENSPEFRIKKEFCKAFGVRNAQRGPEMLNKAVKKCIEKIWAEIEDDKEQNMTAECENNARKGLEIAVQTSKHNISAAKKIKSSAGSTAEGLKAKLKSRSREKSSGNITRREKSIVKTNMLTRIGKPSTERSSSKYSQSNVSSEHSNQSSDWVNTKAQHLAKQSSTKYSKKTTQNQPKRTQINSRKSVMNSLQLDLAKVQNKTTKKLSEGHATTKDHIQSTCSENCSYTCLPPERSKAKQTKQTQTTNESDAIPYEMPRLPFYDCEDKELMHTMLKIGMKHLAKNPKYVLAALPESYKLPLLREWIYQRYGKSYSKDQLIKSVKASKNIFHAIDKIVLPVNTVKMRDLAMSVNDNSDCQNYILNRVKEVKRNFYSTINTSLMSQTRTFWLALRATLCEPSPRNMFFAYYPSHLADINHFRPWRPKIKILQKLLKK